MNFMFFNITDHLNCFWNVVGAAGLAVVEILDQLVYWLLKMSDMYLYTQFANIYHNLEICFFTCIPFYQIMTLITTTCQKRKIQNGCFQIQHLWNYFYLRHQLKYHPFLHFSLHFSPHFYTLPNMLLLLILLSNIINIMY